MKILYARMLSDFKKTTAACDGYNLYAFCEGKKCMNASHDAVMDEMQRATDLKIKSCLLHLLALNG